MMGGGFFDMLRRSSSVAVVHYCYQDKYINVLALTRPWLMIAPQAIASRTPARPFSIKSAVVAGSCLFWFSWLSDIKTFDLVFTAQGFPYYRKRFCYCRILSYLYICKCLCRSWEPFSTAFSRLWYCSPASALNHAYLLVVHFVGYVEKCRSCCQHIKGWRLTLSRPCAYLLCIFGYPVAFPASVWNDWYALAPFGSYVGIYSSRG